MMKGGVGETGFFGACFNATVGGPDHIVVGDDALNGATKRGGNTGFDLHAGGNRTGYQLLDNAVAAQHLTRNIRLELPGFLGLAVILSTCDLIATLPRHIEETLARATGLQVLPCPFAMPVITTISLDQCLHIRPGIGVRIRLHRAFGQA